MVFWLDFKYLLCWELGRWVELERLMCLFELFLISLRLGRGVGVVLKVGRY